MKQPGVLSSALRVFDFSFGQMLWSRRSVFLALLVGAPMAVALAVRLVAATQGLPVINGAGLSGPTLFGVLIWLLFVRFIVPVLGVFYGTSLIADEVDDKTITYLFTRPVPRSAVLLGKYFSYLACVVLLVLPSVVVVYFLIVPIGGSIGGAFPSLLADLVEAAAHRRAGLRLWVGIDGPADSRLFETIERGVLPPGTRSSRHAPGLLGH
jgi:ABC-2 type transport system permease protein